MEEDIVNNIFSVMANSFTDYALAIFDYQYLHNKLYRSWVDTLNINIRDVTSIKQIPFLPISFFKSHNVVTTQFEPEVIFTSSGTTQQQTSKHFVKDVSIYTQSFVKAFELFYESINNYCIIGLLPSYLDRSGSSLVAMVDYLIKKSGHPLSGFYLYDHNKLNDVLQQLESNKQKTLLIGVTFALLDFAREYPLHLNNTIVMETGGMKGRKREMIRDEVHTILQEAFGLTSIHSEYGMTELLSQAYSKGAGMFVTPPWMKVLVREEDDPLHVASTGRGLINVIDLANIYSCSFIATDDVGTVHANKTFEVVGRMDNSDVRGCNLMIV